MKKNESGMALIIVLAVISILLVAALELSRKTGAFALTSARDADRITAEETAMTGVHLAMALLCEDAAKTDVDSLQEDWASAKFLSQAVEALGISSRNLTIAIEDELGKLPVNALIKKYPGNELNPDLHRVFERFFLQLTDEPAPLLNCIKDWLDHRDNDAVTGITGAESDYYLCLDSPYTCANAPFTHISQIFHVRGITRELFAGSRDDKDLQDPVVPEKSITVHGIDTSIKDAAYYTFLSRVNINTANETVIRALLPEIKSDFAKDIVEYRLEQSDNENYTHTLNKGWPDLIAGFTSSEKKAFDRLVRYDTNLFGITVLAKTHKTNLSLYALVRRSKQQLTGKWSCSILKISKEK